MSRRKFFAQSAALIAVPMFPALAAAATKIYLYEWGAFIGHVEIDDQEFNSEKLTHIKRVWLDGQLIWQEQ